MESRIIRIGSSLGLIIPKVFANECGLCIGTPLSIDIGDDNIVISKQKSLREGWDKAFGHYAASSGEDDMLPDYIDTEVDNLLSDGEKI